MAEAQRLLTPLTEEGIQLEPATPPQKRVAHFIQRAWSMMFGRRGNVLQAIYADRGGAMAIASVPLSDLVLVSQGNCGFPGWTDLGGWADIIYYWADGLEVSCEPVQFGIESGTPLWYHFPQAVSVFASAGAGWSGAVSGVAHCRCKFAYMNFPGAQRRKYIAYRYPDS